MREAEEQVTSLAKVRSYAQDNVSQEKKNGKVSWFMKTELFFGQYILHRVEIRKKYTLSK